MVHSLKNKPVAYSEYREITAKDSYDGRQIEKYAFSGCILGSLYDAKRPYAPKDFVYDINVLARTDQVELAALIGFLHDAGWSQEDKNMVRFSADYKEQLSLFGENECLKEGTDFEIHLWAGEGSKKQAVVSVYNPVMSQFFRHPFPFAVEREVKKYLVAGTVTNAAIRTRNSNGKDDKKKIISITHYPGVAEQLRAFADLNELHYSPWDYWLLVGNGKKVEKRRNSTWFYKPKEIKKYGFLLPSFEIDSEVYQMPNYNDDILRSQLSLSRLRSYKYLVHKGLLDPPFSSKELLVGEIESAQILLDQGKIHPTYAAEIKKNCEKALKELEEPKMEDNSKNTANAHFKKKRWKNMRSGMNP